MKVQLIPLKHPKHIFPSNLFNKKETPILTFFFKMFSLSLLLVDYVI